MFDEVSLQIVMGELDTISDFVAYLQAKENLRSKVISHGAGEEDLLALYLHQGRQFPANYDRIVIDGGLWEKLRRKPEFVARKQADAESYIWDKLIDEFGGAAVDNFLEFGPTLAEAEIGLRVMAREDRFSRRILGQSFNEFMALAAQRKVESRMARSPSGIVYVFLALPHGTDRNRRLQQLELRCFVARSQFQESNRAIGIATEVYERGKGHSLDVCYLQKDTWSAHDQKTAEGIQRDLGYFANPVTSEKHVDEFPGARPDGIS